MSELEFEKRLLRQVSQGLSCGALIGVASVARMAVGLRPPSQCQNGALPRNSGMVLEFKLPYLSENTVLLQNPL